MPQDPSCCSKRGAWNNEMKAFERSFGWKPNPPMPPRAPHPTPIVFLWILALGWWLQCLSNGILSISWHQLAGALQGLGSLCHWQCRVWGCRSASAFLSAAWPAAPNQPPFPPGVPSRLPRKRSLPNPTQRGETQGERYTGEAFPATGVDGGGGRVQSWERVDRRPGSSLHRVGRKYVRLEGRDRRSGPAFGAAWSPVPALLGLQAAAPKAPGAAPSQVGLRAPGRSQSPALLSPSPLCPAYLKTFAAPPVQQSVPREAELLSLLSPLPHFFPPPPSAWMTHRPIPGCAGPIASAVLAGTCPGCANPPT